MAHKSKTQRAKATATKANRKERQQREEEANANIAKSSEEASAEEKKKVSLLKKSETKPEEKKQAPAAAKKVEKPKKTRFQFLKDVRAEMKRVTWPTRQDVTRWTGVVVGALIFFGVYTGVLDWGISNGLVLVSSLGA